MATHHHSAAPMTSQKISRPRKRDAEATKQRILQAALEEFSTHGHSGARVDRVAEGAGVSKPMIYEYFGDKDTIYAAALREAYVRIRQAEKHLDLDALPPEAAIRELVRFTMNHFRRNPWFVSMLAIENLRGGQTIRQVGDAPLIQSVLVERVGEVLKRGIGAGLFRDDIDPVDFYVFIASLCYFPISNTHTLKAVFKLPVDDAWLDKRSADATEMLLGFLRQAL